MSGINGPGEGEYDDNELSPEELLNSIIKQLGEALEALNFTTPREIKNIEEQLSLHIEDKKLERLLDEMKAIFEKMSQEPAAAQSGTRGTDFLIWRYVLESKLLLQIKRVERALDPLRSAQTIVNNNLDAGGELYEQLNSDLFYMREDLKEKYPLDLDYN